VTRRLSPEEAIRRDLEALARCRRLCDWMFAQFASFVKGSVAEVGAGIGTFSKRLLGAGAESLLLIEPDEESATELQRRFGDDGRVTTAKDTVPGCKALQAAAGTYDFVLCQNVLEHIEDDSSAVAEMAAALRPGGRLGLLVPARGALYGHLDELYGHQRRYERETLRDLLAHQGLVVEELYGFNVAGQVGWWLSNRTRSTGIGGPALALYDLGVPLWRGLERRRRPGTALSLVAIARR
jgi:SAM-dependent methyltransferase